MNSKKYNAGLIAARTELIPKDIFSDQISEIKTLTSTLGYNISVEYLQELNKPNPHTYIGSGKTTEIKNSIPSDIYKIFINNDISPSQNRNLEKYFKLPVVDRSSLVLEIFKQHASTYQAKTQIELAILKYQLPRLTGLWTHLDREKGGSNVSKGMGERQINIDRSLLRNRINVLSEKLKRIKTQHNTQIKKRKNTLQVCLTGYTNVGKTSLMNKLADLKLKSENKLFTSLDSTTRLLSDKFKPNILLTDTVGLIKHLPAELIQSFQTTLSAISESDLILHVIDATPKNWEYKYRAAEEIINKFSKVKIPIINVFNKIDLIKDDIYLQYLKIKYQNSIFVSNFDEKLILNMKKTIENHFLQDFVSLKIKKDTINKELEYFLWNNSIVKNIEYQPLNIIYNCSMHKINFRRFSKYFTLKNVTILNSDWAATG